MRWIGCSRKLCALVAIAATLTSPAVTVANAADETPVDLELVLAVDVSLAMDIEEQKYQRAGYVLALRSREVLDAIKLGEHGRIALTYVEWAGAHYQRVAVPWRMIANGDDADAFAADLATEPITQARMTSISKAIAKAAALFDNNGFAGKRRVIDVSGDGPNNIGGRVDAARDAAVDSGIVVNGLALKFKRPEGPYSYFDLPDLDRYYAACVIGGPGSFMIAVQDQKSFGQAIRQKLVLEIADLGTRAPPQRIQRTSYRQRTQFRIGKPTYDCLIGEKMWDSYQTDRW